MTPTGAAPEERAHFTATKFGSRIFIFGGYGGSGQVFNDMWLLHFDTAEGSYAWENITDSIGGVGPSPRFDHCAFIYPITPNSSSYDKLLIMGGRDLSTMFSDSHMLDLNSMQWEETQPPTLPYEVRWAAAGAGVDHQSKDIATEVSAAACSDGKAPSICSEGAGQWLVTGSHRSDENQQIDWLKMVVLTACSLCDVGLLSTDLQQHV